MTHGQPDSITLPDTISSGGQGTSPQNDGAQNGATQGGTAEQKVSWLELFFDLIFVVAFDQLARRLGDSPGLENIAEFALLFTAVWWAWAGNTLFAARFGNESRIYRWATLTQLVSMSLIALTLRGDVKDTGLAVALAFGVNRLIQCVQYLLVSRARPEAAAFAQRVAQTFGGAALLWLGSALLPAGSAAQLLIWCAALALEIVAPILARGLSTAVLPHQGHLPERVGLLQIIALGAIVTETVNGSRQQALTLPTLLPALGAILTTVALWRLYFDQARALPLLAAHVEGQVGRLLAWLYGHLPFTLSVIMLGVGLGHGLSAVDAKKDAVNQQFVAWPLAGTLFTLAMLRLNSMQVARRRVPDRSLLALAAGIAGCVVLAFLDLDTTELHLSVAALTLLLAAVVAADPATRRLGQLEEKVTEQMEEGDAPRSLEEPVSAQAGAASAGRPASTGAGSSARAPSAGSSTPE
ncbi:low temperature requirement protein A [Deinococcus koreensis]|uniref:Low temperature requirement A n=1 Tax=Deinococcus koreensis TaxID=2054903 RepID=A0A2K3V0I2_9DEIO|nr:low temperature requirement protein A [Deinococcus koreensis]PNY82296.1 low temperature requirement A [Deinococcus koreensis]